MAQVERYVRLSVTGLLHPDDECIVGLAFEPGESTFLLREKLRQLMEEAGSVVLGQTNGATDAGCFWEMDGYLAEAVHALVDERWPGRPHFIEVQHGEEDGWVQVFQPYDLPVKQELIPMPPPPHRRPLPYDRPARPYNAVTY